MNATRCGVCLFQNRDAYFPPIVIPNSYTANSPSHPSESEITLQRNLTEMRCELEKVDADMELSRAALSRMKIRRRRILSSMQQHEKSLRPVLSIPDDILRQIFEWSVVLCSKMKREDSLDSRIASPWTLSHTCHHWRTVAVSHPSLWCNIFMPHNDQHGTGRTLLLELSLQRSAGAQRGLDIDIQYCDGDSSNAYESFVNMIAPILKPTSHRWHSLIAYSSYLFTNMLLCDSVGWSFEGITRLDLSFNGRRLPWQLDEPDAVTTAFRDTPNLTQLSVDNLPDEDALNIRWESLVFYESRHSDLRVLRRLSAVETLILDDRFYLNWSATFDDMKNTALIRLPSLHSLAVKFNYYDNILADLSDILEVPTLRRLSIHLSGFSGGTKRCPNVHFLEHLTHLSIFMDEGLSYVLDFLHCTEYVRVLCLRGQVLTAAVLRALQKRDTVPLLEWLHVEDCAMDLLAEEVFMVMEAKQCRLHIVNREGKVYAGARLSVDALVTYRSLKEHGMITTDVNHDFDFF